MATRPSRSGLSVSLWVQGAAVVLAAIGLVAVLIVFFADAISFWIGATA